MLVIDKAVAPPASKKSGSATTKIRGKNYFYLGLILMLLLGVFIAYEWRWAWLSELQADDVYKQLSGFAILTYLAHQWHCSVLRNRGLMRLAGRLIHRHKVIGSLAPLIFFTHSQTIGFGYLQLLSLVYFALFFTGLFNVETMAIRNAWFHTLWVIVHVTLATGLLFLMGYHIYISYAYR
ncbi:hypothetical protein GO003_011155 [Methylicorpusculum oleiharenae]|uniref:hypothetical protein n=1 Tax=Methylicorpusculum oleiharenae TaxID=1338687 RepID=UPI00135805EB|nr:hypothetical protein [Methylicorpusculum oleiharenae]MCD2450951.1 hypothetical protein [Methylicorpusculum oleiharenae]